MSAVFNAIRAAQNAIACPVLAANNFVLGSVGSFIPGLNQPALSAINALRRLYGCNEPDDVELPPPPFEGGQCAGVTYNVFFQRRQFSGGTWGWSTNQFRQGVGPVSIQDFGGPASCDGQPGSVPAGANLLFNGVVSGPSPLVNQCVDVAPGYRFIAINRTDGQPDNCGDPPREFPPPTTFNFNTDITYNTEEGDEVTVTIPFVFAPIEVNFDGSFRLPFTFDFGGNTFTGNFSLNPDFSLTINPPGVPPGSDQGTDDLPPGNPDDEVEPLPLNEKIIGVVVNSSIIGEQQFTTIATQGMPNILAPRAGSIKFAYSLGAATFWSNDIDVKGDRIFIPCPFSQGADAVVVSPAPGVALQWVPISGPPLATKADLA